MNTQTKSVLDPFINYDFLFAKDNKLDSRDKGIESDVYQIRIFGNEHHIVIGGNHIYPEKGKENITYFIVYLLYDMKVVCKIGIYEIDIKALGTYTNRTFDFTKHELLLDNTLYRSPDKLNPFIVKATSYKKDIGNPEPETKEPQDEEDQDEEDQGEEPQDEEDQGEADQGEAVDVEEPLAAEEHDETGPIVQSNAQPSLLSWLKNAEITNAGKFISKKAINNIFTNMTKADSTLDDKYTDYVKQDEANKKTIEFHHDSFFEDKTRPITRSILILFEYLLDIKFVEIDSNENVKRVTFLNKFTNDTIIELFVSNKTQSSLRLNPVFKRYDPTKIVLVKEDIPNSYSMVKEIDLNQETNTYKSLLSDIKKHLLETPNEYINDQKTVVKNMNKLRKILRIK